jgi:DNA-binding transcriptional ArsR family regulator
MPTSAIEFLREPEKLRVALSPIRLRILERLREPGSATEIASELKMSRQRVGYHLRTLEQAGLIELVEERRRRGFIERILKVSADAFVVDPSMIGKGSAREGTDQFTAERLIQIGADLVRDVARLEAGAEAKGKRLLTFTIETEVNLVGPADVGHFTAALTQELRNVISEFDAPTVGHRYRVIVGGHPAQANPAGEK